MVGWHHQLNGHKFENSQEIVKDSEALCIAIHGVAKTVWWGCHNKVKQTIRLKQQKFIVPQFWRLEVQDDGSQQVWFLKASLLGLQMATILLCP